MSNYPQMNHAVMLVNEAALNAGNEGISKQKLWDRLRKENLFPEDFKVRGQIIRHSQVRKNGNIYKHISFLKNEPEIKRIISKEPVAKVKEPRELKAEIEFESSDGVIQYKGYNVTGQIEGVRKVIIIYGSCILLFASITATLAHIVRLI